MKQGTEAAARVASSSAAPAMRRMLFCRIASPSASLLQNRELFCSTRHAPDFRCRLGAHFLEPGCIDALSRSSP